MSEPGVVAPRWITYTRLPDFKPYPGNPKDHDLPAIMASLETHGFTDPIEVCERTGYVASGHGRIEGLQALRASGYAGTPDGIVLDDDGEWCVPTQRGWESKNDAHLRAYVITANRLTEAGGWDKNLLAEMLHSLATGPDPDLFESLGYTADEMDDLMSGIDPDLMDQGPEDELATGDGGGEADDDEGAGRRADPVVCCPDCGSTFRLSESERV